MGKFLGPITCEKMNALAGKLAGHIDFYYWKGIPCWRLWPHGAEAVKSLARANSAAAFAEVARRKSRVPSLLRQQFAVLAQGSTDTWGDVFTRWQMVYYNWQGELPPEIIDIALIYGSGIQEIIVKLAFGTGPVGNFYLGRLNWKANPDGHKTFRGTQVKCTPKTLSMMYPRRGLTVKSRGLSGYQPVHGDGRTKGIGFGGDWMPDPFYQNKCLVYYGPQDEIWSPLDFAMQSNRYHSQLGMGQYQRAAGIASMRARMWFAPVLPSGWTLDDVNGMRWWYKSNSTMFNKSRPVRFESPLGMKIIRTWPGLEKSITVPFYPFNLDPVYCYAIPLDYTLPAIWDWCETDLEWISDAPYTQFIQCKLSKGLRNELNYEFHTPVVGNFGLTYVPLTGGEYLLAPIAANPEINPQIMTAAEEYALDYPAGHFNEEQERTNAWIWDVNMNRYGPTTYDPKLEYTKENFPELFNVSPNTTPFYQGGQPPADNEGYPPDD